MSLIVIGLMSGTSVDGIDAALVQIDGQGFELHVQLLAGATYSYPDQLRQKILAACAGTALSIAEWAELDDQIAQAFAHAAIAIQHNQPAADLIGSHGQTVFHRPPAADHLGYSVQLGRGEVLAALTHVTTISNFRAADIAAGGQGAPLVPKIDAYLLASPTQSRCIQNIGGIGNVGFLPAFKTFETPQAWDAQILGWDTGPGNVLLDLAVQKLTNHQLNYDADGAWAAQGQPCQPLVDQWLAHPFFHLPPPKSTGRELFGVDYLEHCWQDAQPYQLSDADWLATLTELTVRSIVLNYQAFLPHMPDQVCLCGGGSQNQYLRLRLQAHLGGISLLTTSDLGLDSDYKEAIAFAVLAYWRNFQVTSNLPHVTGANRAVSLGEIHLGSQTVLQYTQ
jgi:anhydro-N-acetylmuramic acid kinase